MVLEPFLIQVIGGCNAERLLQALRVLYPDIEWPAEDATIELEGWLRKGKRRPRLALSTGRRNSFNGMATCAFLHALEVERPKAERNRLTLAWDVLGSAEARRIVGRVEELETARLEWQRRIKPQTVKSLELALVELEMLQSRVRSMRDNMQALAQKSNSRGDRVQGNIYFCARACYENLLMCLTTLDESERVGAAIADERPLIVSRLPTADGETRFEVTGRRYDMAIHAAVKGCFRAYADGEHWEYVERKGDVEADAYRASWAGETELEDALLRDMKRRDIIWTSLSDLVEARRYGAK